MKKLVFLLLISSTVFSNTLSKVNYNIHSGKKVDFLSVYFKYNNSSHYNIKKYNEDYKKTSFINRIKNSDRKIFISELGKNTTKALQTLRIKLDSIKQLHKNGLLKKEVLVNTAYYNNFLSEIKKSSIVNDEYIFLENELLKIAVVNTTKKYQTTRNISWFLVIVITLILFFFFTSKKKKIVLADLTKQEIAIKELITNGKTNKEIAIELHISLNTVKTHVSNIYQKLNISNRKALLLKYKN